LILGKKAGAGFQEQDFNISAGEAADLPSLSYRALAFTRHANA